MTGFFGAPWQVVSAALAAFFICGAGNVHNDIVDISVDKISHPSRALAAGRLSRKAASSIAIVIALTGLALAFYSNSTVALVGGTTLCLLYLYNVQFKRRPLIGNCVIALLGALTFMTGGLAVDLRSAFELPGPILAAVFAFIFHLVREIVKDVQDMQGDRTAGIRTLPQLIGAPNSLLLALVLFIILAVLTCVPIITQWYGIGYALIVLIAIDLPLLTLLSVTWRKPSERNLRLVSSGLKAGMVAGLVALVVG